MSVELAETGEGPTPSNADLAYQIIHERLVMLDIRPSEPINDEGLARQLRKAHAVGIVRYGHAERRGN